MQTYPRELLRYAAIRRLGDPPQIGRVDRTRVLFWTDEVIARLDDVLALGFEGNPRVIVAQGGPGAGRTSFLAEVTERANRHATALGLGLTKWAARGTATGQQPLHALQELGVATTGPSSSDIPSTLALARSLREAVDSALDDGVLLITIDDIQWLDPESVDAITDLVEHAEAERFVVAVTFSQLESFQHAAWQRFVLDSPLVDKFEIEALLLEHATALARELQPVAGAELVERLWRHTAGNPSFFSSLLRRVPVAELDTMERFPAPDEYALVIEQRLADLGDDALRLARAASTIGDGWMTVAFAAYVADLHDPARAVDVLVAESILERRTRALGLEIRMLHSVIQATVYQEIPARDRTGLHRRAADGAADELTELTHRYAAAETFDDDLGGELERAAERQRNQRSYRLASTYLEWASRVSTSGLQRSRRLNESLFEAVLSGRNEYVRSRLSELRQARDRRGAAVVEALLAVADNEWIRATQILEPFSQDAERDLTTYRIGVLLGWSTLTSGGPIEAVVAAFESAESANTRDDALAGLATFATGIISGREDPTATVTRHLAGLSSRPAAVPLSDTYWLIGVGVGMVLQGRLDEAIAPLRELTDRMATGFLDVGDGACSALLAFAYEMSGELDVAAPHYRAAEALLKPTPHPMFASFVAWGHISMGDKERADEILAQLETNLQQHPWVDAIPGTFNIRVYYTSVFGTEEEKASLLPRARAIFGDLADQHGHIPLVLSMIWLAYLWAGELDTADSYADELEALTDLPWTPSIAAWIRGRTAEARGDAAGAVRLLDQAIALDTSFMPPLTEFMRSDRTQLGGRLETTSASPGRRLTAVPPIRPASVLDSLSEREREVAALVANGLSYVQISRELFITRSTVGFHLSKIYAKTDTASRHELTELMRAG